MQNRPKNELEPAQITKLLKQAENLFQQGSFTKALEYFQKIQDSLKTKNVNIQSKINSCYKLLLRKYWRQSKLNEFETLAQTKGLKETLILPLARMKGPQELLALASHPTHIHSKLASGSLANTLKNALLSLRQQAEFKETAEGWLALLKGDYTKALSLFTDAANKTPIHAKIGKGIVYLAQQDFIQAQQCLSELKPFANKFYPVLTQAMKWNSTDYSHLRPQSIPLLHHLHSDSINTLKDTLTQTPKTNKSLMGWLWLRIGDHYWSDNNKKEAIKAWREARKNNKGLALDALKRLFFANLYSNEDLNIHLEEIFRELYLGVKEKSSKEARELTEYLVFDANALDFDPSTLRSGEKWCLSPPPPEIQLLWLHLFFNHNVEGLLTAYFLKSEPQIVCENYPWSTWNSLFQTLDPFYSHQEKYLRYKLGLCNLFQQHSIARQTLAQLLQTHPHFKEEFLPSYVKFALKAALSKDITLKEYVSNEIKSLQKSFPYEYALIRLSVLTGNSTIPWKQQLMPFAGHLSEPLFAALTLQVAIDTQTSLSCCLSLIPDERLFNIDQEADARLFYALSHPYLKLTKAQITKFFYRLASCNEKKHKLLSEIEATEELTIPYSLIKDWQSQDSKSGYPDLHLGLYYCFNDKFEKSLDAFELAYKRLSHDAPERYRVNATLEHHRYGMPDLSDMMKFMPQELFQFFKEFMNEHN